MNLLDIRTRVLEQVDWQPVQDQGFIDLTNNFINRAYNVLFNEAPFLLEGEQRIVLDPDAVSASADTVDRMRVNPTDQHVLERDVTGLSADGVAWVVDGSWDGRWLDVTDPNGIIRRVQTREWWRDDGSPIFDRVSLVNPWPNAADAAMAYRVTTPEYHVPGDVVEIRSARLFADPNHVLTVGNQYEMERAQLVDFQGRQSGLPEVVFRGAPFQLASPNRAATVALAAANWGSATVADVDGEFDYCFTYVWGSRDDSFRTPRGNLREVTWESGPSPISASITSTDGAAGIRLTMPDADFQLGFGVPSSVRLNRSGYRKRIYARRVGASTGVGGGIARTVEAPNVFMLLAEVSGNTEVYDHIGDDLLDYDYRLKDIHGYQSLRIFPIADARYELDLRVQYRPGKLINDYDVPRINEDVMDALIQKSLVAFLEYDGKPELANIAEGRYRVMLETLTKRYAQISYYKIRKRPARVRGSVGASIRSRRVTYTGVE